MLQTKTKRELEHTKKDLAMTKTVLSNLMEHLNLQYRHGKKRSYIARIPRREK